MIWRILPHPVLSAVIALVWLMLVNGFAAGSIVFALVLGIVFPLIVAPYWPNRPELRNPGRIAAYGALVIHDIVKANIHVAMIILFTPNRALRPAWITVPLRLKSPEGITTLAATITLTPGTVTCDLSRDGRSLLVHCLHAPDPDAVAEEIRDRYESRLLEIFR